MAQKPPVQIISPSDPQQHKQSGFQVIESPAAGEHGHSNNGLSYTDPSQPPIPTLPNPSEKQKWYEKAPLIATAAIVLLGVGWLTYQTIFGSSSTVTIDGHVMKVIAMDSGTCKGRLKVQGAKLQNKDVCLDSKAQASSLASVMMANPNPALGMNYSGLKVAPDKSQCAGEFELQATNANGNPICTHGPDPSSPNIADKKVAPAQTDESNSGVTTEPGSSTLPTTLSAPAGDDTSQTGSMNGIATAVAPKVKTPTVKANLAIVQHTQPAHARLAAAVAAPSTVQLYGCPQPGSDGNRIQPVYFHYDGTPDQYQTYFGTFAADIRGVDNEIQNSASIGNGVAHVRWLSDASCNVPIADVTLPMPDGGIAASNVSNIVQALWNAGFNSSSRKYLVFSDVPVSEFCGIAPGIQRDDSPALTNRNNTVSGWALVSLGCANPVNWSDDQLHELVHELGGIQSSAPDSTIGFHCTDSYETMCYNDAPGVVQRIVCPSDAPTMALLDCNDDDYFSANPPAGSYLATHWNIYNSPYLTHSPGTIIEPKPGVITTSFNGATDTLIFKRNANLSVSYADLNNYVSGWHNLGGITTADPTVVSYGPSKLMVFERGSDNSVYADNYNGSTWSGWRNVGPSAASNIAAISSSPGRVNMFYKSLTNGNLITRGWNVNTGWSPLNNLGASLSSDPVAIATSAADIEVYMNDYRKIPYRIVWNGTAWSAWQQIGGGALGNPSVVAGANGRRDLFVRGTNNHIFDRTFSGGKWSAWVDLGGNNTSSPAAFIAPNGQITVYARQLQAVLYKRVLPAGSTTWADWAKLPVTSLASNDPVVATSNTDPNTPYVIFHNTIGLTVNFTDGASPAWGILSPGTSGLATWTTNTPQPVIWDNFSR